MADAAGKGGGWLLRQGRELVLAEGEFGNTRKTNESERGVSGTAVARRDGGGSDADECGGRVGQWVVV